MRPYLSLTALLAAALLSSPARSAPVQQLRAPLVQYPAPPGGGPASGAAVEEDEQIRVMPLGDSITWGLVETGGYRAPLYTRLESTLAQIDYVGSALPYSFPAILDDWHHEGHPGWQVKDVIAHPGSPLAPPSTIEELLTHFDPAVILLHIGSNDILKDDGDWEGALVDLNDLLSRIYATLPTVHVLLAQIIPLRPPIDNAPILALNAGIPPIAQSYTQAGFALEVVDMYSVFESHPNWVNLYEDGVHPNQTGYDLIADEWFDVLKTIDLPQNPPIATLPVVQRNSEDLQAGAFPALTDDLIAAGSATLAATVHDGYDFAGPNPIEALNDGVADGSTTAAWDPVDETWVSTFHLDLTGAPRGYDIERIRGISRSSWEFGAQSFEVQFELVSTPGVFLELGAFRYAYSSLQFATQAGGSGLVELEHKNGLLARGVSAVRFVFHPDPGHNATTSYSEIDVVGKPTTFLPKPPTGLSYRPLTP